MDQAAIELLKNQLSNLRDDIARVRLDQAAGRRELFAAHAESVRQVGVLSERIALLEAKAAKKYKHGRGVLDTLAAVVRALAGIT